MKLKSKLQILTLASLIFGHGRAMANEADAKAKVVDLNQIDLEEVQDNWETTAPVPTVNPDRGMKIKDIIEPTSEYTYASFGKPDPFTIPILDDGRGDSSDQVAETIVDPSNNSKEIKISSPLQNYPLTELKIKGVWQLANTEMRAIVLTPKNEGIVVKVGDPISSGKVLKIEKETIIVRLYRIRKDGIREYEDTKVNLGGETKLAKGSIKLEPGKEAQFPGSEEPASPTDNPFKTPEADAAATTATAAGATAAGAPAAKVKGKGKEKDKKGTTNDLPPAVAPSPIIPGGQAAPAANTTTPPVVTPPGWPYNMGAPAPAKPTSGRPGSTN